MSNATSHPITEPQARKLAIDWFDKTIPFLEEQAGKECTQGDNPAKFPKFKAVDVSKILPLVKTATGRGDPPFTEILKATQSEDGSFLFIAVLHTTQETKGVGGGPETVFNPLVYVVETRQRERPPGWGRFQPYGKRVDLKGGLVRNIPAPDPSKAVKNIIARITQQSNSAEPVVLNDTSFKDMTVPDGVHLLPDPGNRGSYILHIAAMPVTEALAVAILQAFNTIQPNEPGSGNPGKTLK